MKALKNITKSDAQCRYENAIFYSDGRVLLISGDLLEGYKISETITIDDLIKNEPDGWTDIYFMHSNKKGNFMAYAGETSYGGCGFVALKEINSNSFRWVIHLDNCNNFLSVIVTDENVIAHTDAPFPNGSDLIIPINFPEKFTMINKK